MRVEGRLLPTHTAACNAATAQDAPPTHLPPARLLEHAGMSLHEVCFLTSRLAAFGERLAAVDLHALAQGQVRCRMPVVLRDSCDITPWLRELPLSLALSVFVWS